MLRLIPRTIGSVSRQTVRNYSKQSLRLVYPARSLSTTFVPRNEASKELSSVLAKEVEFEKNDQFDMEEYHQTWLKNSGFEIVNTDGKLLGELTKKNGNEVIRAYFDVAQVANGSLDQEMPEAEEEESAEDFGIDENVVSVNLIIENNNSALGFDLYLSTKTNQFTVNGITHFDDAQLAISESAESDTKRQLKYAGPPFVNLAEELQDSIQDYLTSRGVDDQLGDFIVAYSTLKENNEYISWLQNLNKFVS